MVEGSPRLHEADSVTHHGNGNSNIDANGVDSKSSTAHEDGIISPRQACDNENVVLQSDVDLFRDVKDSIETPPPLTNDGDFSHDNELNGKDRKRKDALKVDEGGYEKDTTSRNVECGDYVAFSSNGDQVGRGGSLHADKCKQKSSSPTTSAYIQTEMSSLQVSARAQPTLPLEKASFLSRGMTLFAKGPTNQDVGYSMRNDNDAISVISEITNDVKSESKSVKKYAVANDDSDDALKLHLEESGLVLLKRLIEFLSECPAAEEGLEHTSLNSRRDKSSHHHANNKKRHRGLTLPASAIGWLSTQLLHNSGNFPSDGAGDRLTVPKQQLECLQSLLSRVTNLRVSGEAWPPPQTSVPGKAAEDVVRSAKKSIAVNVLSRFGNDRAPTSGGYTIDGGSCGATPSRCYDENSISEFRRFYHEILHKPDVNMTLFSNATKVVIEGIPPNWVTNLDSLAKLDMFQMERGCILDINHLFFPSDSIAAIMAEDNRDDTREFVVKQNELSHRPNPIPFVYSSLSKLRLSKCAIGEAAGLRRRRTSSCMSLPPPIARFPNLESLDLSRNELFRTRTAFAGLSDLPLLSSINLSYNRLSSLDDIFMYIGNVTELILTGNEISTTRGIDRIFSLERLLLDENRIQHLTHIAGVAKMPFLMNFDLKGNPLEIDDPVSCRVQVFNLFREVRCNKLPKDATFRDMQRLLPILDNEIATKDELVALKSLTYRHAMMPMASIPTSTNKDGIADVKNIDDRSEIVVNMPDHSGHIRSIVKSSLVNLAHLRMPMSRLPTETAGRLSRVDSYIFRDDQKSVRVLFSMDELLRSIHQTVVRESFIDQNHIFRRETLQSLSSLSECKDGTTGNSGESPTMPLFPFSLPHSLLTEADDDVWKPNRFIDPSECIVWDVMDGEDISQARDVAIGDHSHGSAHPLDAMQFEAQPTNSLEDQPVNDDEIVARKKILSDGNITDPTSRKSEFSGIWEKSYRDNVLTRQSAESEPIDFVERNTDMLDLNAAEESSRYDGPRDYGPLLVFSDIDLYFDTFVFPRDSTEDGVQEPDRSLEITAPRIQLFKFDRDIIINKHRQQGSFLSSKLDFRERFVGIWKVDVLACGSFARSRLPPMKVPRNGFHGDTIIRAGKVEMMSESRKFILCLSESAIYFIIDDEMSPQKLLGPKRSFPSRIPPTSTFSDACWPHAVVRHPLDCLRGITIGFQFQRLILRFSISNATSSSSVEFTYVVLTSNKMQTISFLQKAPLPIADESQLSSMGTLIDNDDKTFLDSLGPPKSNEVLIHYQILLQFWKRRERRPARRSFVLTDSRVCLIDETYVGDGTHPETEKDKKKKLGDVSLVIIDSAALSQVTEVRAANEDPRKITLVILPQNKLKRYHRWRLICNDGEGAERLVEDVRKAMGVRA